MKVSIPRQIVNACATENSRYAIRGVAIIKSKTGLGAKAVATNGRMLVAYDCDTEGQWPGSIEGQPDKNDLVIVCRDSLDLARPSRGFIDIEITSSGVFIDVEHLHDRRVRANTLEPNFPPFQDVIPEADDSTVWVSVNTHMLHAIAETLATPGNESRVTLGITPPEHPGASNKPVRVAGRNNAVGVLMPIVTRDDTTDDWNSNRDKFV
jgi:hypothetical protein